MRGYIRLIWILMILIVLSGCLRYEVCVGPRCAKEKVVNKS